MKKITVGIFAHVDAGKTTLSEALLYKSGNIKKPGRVDTKDSFLDTDEQERNRGITIFSKQAVINFDNSIITLVDTPGHVDFSAEAERSLQIIDYAILLISGSDGVQGHTKTLWNLLEKSNIPTFIFINKTDIDGVFPQNIISDLKTELDENILNFNDGIDDSIYETIALTDENLMHEYLDSGIINDKDIIYAIRKRKIFPCFYGSALKIEGVDDFLRFFNEFTVQPAAPSELGGKVYKISSDDKGQRLTFLKITGGCLKVKDTIETEKDYTEKINEIRIYSGDKYQSVQEATAGTVCALTGLKKTYAGQGLGFEVNSADLTAVPIFNYRVILPDGADISSSFKKLKELEQEETLLNVTWNEHLKEIQIRLMGEIQLEVLKQLIHKRFGLDVHFEEGHIVYKETIKNKVEGVGHYEPLRHYSEVHLLLEPLERGAGMMFETDVSEDVLAKNWQRLILGHLMEKEHIGVLTGSPVTDIKITLKAGRAHEKHTEGGDFRQATYRAVRHGLIKAESLLLEPYYDFVLEIPSEYTGRAMTDMDRIGAEFSVPQTRGNITRLNGNAPADAIRNYQREIISYTRGMGKITCTFSGYDVCKNSDKVIESMGYNFESDLENTADSVFCSHGAGFNVKWNEVENYMHLESVLKPKKAEEKTETVRSSGGNISSDEELLKIFEKTYGKVETKNPNHTLKTPKATLDGYKLNDRKIPDKEYLLVDGYNIIFAWPDLKELSKVSLESARDRLIERLSVYKLFKKYDIIVVFDAYKVKGNRGEKEEKDGIKIVYTKESQTADTYIEITARELTKNYRVTVATSDALEQMIIFGSGAYRFSARIFEEDVISVENKIRTMIKNNNLKSEKLTFKDVIEFVKRKGELNEKSSYNRR